MRPIRERSSSAPPVEELPQRSQIHAFDYKLLIKPTAKHNYIKRSFIALTRMVLIFQSPTENKVLIFGIGSIASLFQMEIGYSYDSLRYSKIKMYATFFIDCDNAARIFRCYVV